MLHGRHERNITSVAFSPYSTHLVSASNDGTIRLWDTENGQSVFVWNKAHHAEVNSISISPDGKRLASAGWDGMVRLWELQTREPVGEPLEHAGSVSSVAFSADGRRLASAGEGHIQLWDAESR